MALHVGKVPILKRVLGRIAKLADGKASSLTQLDAELHGPKPILV